MMTKLEVVVPEILTSHWVKSNLIKSQRLKKYGKIKNMYVSGITHLLVGNSAQLLLIKKVNYLIVENVYLLTECNYIPHLVICKSRKCILQACPPHCIADGSTCYILCSDTRFTTTRHCRSLVILKENK